MINKAGGQACQSESRDLGVKRPGGGHGGNAPKIVWYMLFNTSSLF